MTTVRSVMTPRPRTIRSDTPIRAALSAFEANGLRHLPVVDDDALVGIVSDRDLRAWRQALLDEAGGEDSPVGRAALDAPVAKLMTYDVTTISPDAPVSEAVAVLLDLRVGALPVVEEGKLVGIVTTIDLLELLGERLEVEPEVLTASDLMSTELATVRRGDDVEAAVDVMLDRGVRHVPVLDEDDRLVGLVTQRDLLAMENGGRRRVEDVMTVPVTVAPETPVTEVAQVLREHEFGCVPVVDSGCLVGMVTEGDFVAAYTVAPPRPPEEPGIVEQPTAG